MSTGALRRLPEFSALERVLAALSPLRPEGRRKVIEAVHALLAIGPGRQRQDPASRRRRAIWKRAERR